MITVNLNLPCIRDFDDYHAISPFVAAINFLVQGKKVQYKELGFLGNYRFLLYIDENDESRAIEARFRALVDKENSGCGI